MEQYSVFYRFAVALFIGFLIGLQREYAFNKEGKELAAGVRTFSLIGLIGCAAAMITDKTGSPLPFIAVIFIIGLLFLVNHFIQAWHGTPGLTTEVAALMTAMTGALTYWNQITLAVAIGVTITILLSFKLELHSFARNLTRADVFSTLKFAVISAIILPILPNKLYGPEPFNIFNPYKIWLFVVFISAISFVGYIFMKLIGANKGITLTGLLGGLASSTAVTISMTQKSKSSALLAKSFALAILIAWTVMFARILIIVAVINSSLVALLWTPFLISIVSGLLYCIYLYRTQKAEPGQEQVAIVNPFELTPAIKFGLLFTLIMFVAKAAQLYMGDTGLYIASFITGLADADAIVLSVARLENNIAAITPLTAVKAIVYATVSNTFIKGMIAIFGGSVQLRKALLPGFVLMMVTLVVVTFLL
ncbi:MAG TPA: MgtC/SapB family protein [bacterium]|nr:MgtC/SapB family protein [bacterium]HPN42812.1 MgtC/SapB family protein [bacterium]